MRGIARRLDRDPRQIEPRRQRALAARSPIAATTSPRTSWKILVMLRYGRWSETGSGDVRQRNLDPTAGYLVDDNEMPAIGAQRSCALAFSSSIP